jgi:hypothetical protein
MTDPLPASPGSLADKSADFTWDDHALEPGIALALSGGGFRAMLFHAGALMRLNELGLLSTLPVYQASRVDRSHQGILRASGTNSAPRMAPDHMRNSRKNL